MTQSTGLVWEKFLDLDCGKHYIIAIPSAVEERDSLSFSFESNYNVIAVYLKCLGCNKQFESVQN